MSSVLVLLIGVGAWAVVTGHRRPLCEFDIPPLVRCELVVVRGIVGSEKVTFFTSPEARLELRRHGLIVDVEAAGSRTMACRSDLADYDFAFPGSPWAAADVLRAAAERQPSKWPVAAVGVFESPIVVVTFTQVAQQLRATGAVTDDLRYFDVEDYLNNVFLAGKRWRQLGVAAPFPAFARAVLMSTRLDTSNSAELYLALVSHVVNGNVPIQPQDLDEVRPKVVDLFRAQGSTGLSSDEPFDQ